MGRQCGRSGVASLDTGRQPGLDGEGGPGSSMTWADRRRPLEIWVYARRSTISRNVDVARCRRYRHSDVGAAGLLGFGIFGPKLDLGVGVDEDDALGRRRYDDKPDLLQRISGRGEHLAQLGRDVAAHDLLLAGGGDDVAGGDRLHAEAALQRIGRALQPQILRGRREDDPLRRLGVGLAHLDEIAEPISALAPRRPSSRMI